MNLTDVVYYPEILKLYDQLSKLNEPYSLNISHSAQWKTLFTKLVDYTEKTAEILWPIPTSYIKDKQYDTPNTVYEYTTVVLKILKYYKPEKGLFENYYYKVLSNDVFKKKSQINSRIINAQRAIPLSGRAQKKYSKCIKILKKYNREHPDTALEFLSEESKKIFIENGIFKDEKSVNRFIRSYLLSYKSTKKTNDNEEKDLIEKQPEEKHSAKAALEIDIVDIQNNLKDFFDFVDENFVMFINLKKQNTTDQLKKEIFMRKIITCYYYSKIRALTEYTDFSKTHLNNMLKDKKFLDREILNSFMNNDKAIENIIKSGDPEKIKDLGKSINKEPVTLEMISITEKKAFNYGYKRIKKFRDLLKAQADLKNIPEEIQRFI